MTLASIDVKNDRLRDRMQNQNPAIQRDLDERLDASWIFHDAAIEGVVLSHGDVQAAMAEGEAPTDGLSPSLPEVRLLRTAIRSARDLAVKRKRPTSLEVIRRFYTIVTPEAGGKATLCAPHSHAMRAALRSLSADASLFAWSAAFRFM